MIKAHGRLDVISRIFTIKQQIHLITIYIHCFIFKICQTATGKSMAVNFTIFESDIMFSFTLYIFYESTNFVHQ